MTDPPLPFELPPGEATLLCACGFETEPFCFIEHLYRCSRCETIDRPTKVPFLYEPPPCSRCGGRFERSDRIHASWMRAAYLLSKRTTITSTDYVECPKCRRNTLGVNSLCVDYQVREHDYVRPGVGDRLHARTMKSDHPRVLIFLWSPRLASEYSLSLNVLNREAATIEDGHHEFRVIAVADADPKLTLEYVRPLPPDEWRWYVGGDRNST